MFSLQLKHCLQVLHKTQPDDVILWQTKWSSTCLYPLLVQAPVAQVWRRSTYLVSASDLLVAIQKSDGKPVPLLHHFSCAELAVNAA